MGVWATDQCKRQARVTPDPGGAARAEGQEETGGRDQSAGLPTDTDAHGMKMAGLDVALAGGWRLVGVSTCWHASVWA